MADIRQMLSQLYKVEQYYELIVAVVFGLLGVYLFTAGFIEGKAVAGIMADKPVSERKRKFLYLSIGCAVVMLFAYMNSRLDKRRSAVLAAMSG